MPRGVGYYGFPSEAALAARAMRLAEASVPTPGSIRRRYDRPIGDVGGFTQALVALLRGSSPGSSYDEAIAGQRSTNEAAQARLAALGPEYAGAGVAAGSAADSGLSRLLASKAGATAYGAKQPGIAASRGALAQTGLVNAREEALTQRTEGLRSAFLQAYEQVRQNALSLATANASIHQSDRAFNEQMRQFDVSAARQAAEAGAPKAPDINEDYQQVRGDAFTMAEKFYTREIPNPRYNPNAVDPGPETIQKELPYGEAFKRIRSNVRPLLRQLGYSNSAITKLIRQALQAAGYKTPANPGGGQQRDPTYGPH